MAAIKTTITAAAPIAIPAFTPTGEPLPGLGLIGGNPGGVSLAVMALLEVVLQSRVTASGSQCRCKRCI